MRLSGLALAGLLLIAPACVSQETELATPSPRIPDAATGAVGTLTGADAKRGAAEIRNGKVYGLGVITGVDTPAYGERGYSIEITPHGDQPPIGRNGAIAMDDKIVANLGVGSQVDGFAHLGSNGTYFGGKAESEVWAQDGVVQYGTHTIPPIATKGVLLDIAALKGVERLSAGYAITPEDIEAALARQSSSINSGDVALFHTGWQALAETDPAAFLQGEPGIDVAAAKWLVDRGVVAIGADSWAVEVLPNPDPELIFPVHSFLLGDSGVHILESMDTSALAADGAYEFMFVLGVPRFEGAVQMVINPVAIR